MSLRFVPSLIRPSMAEVAKHVEDLKNHRLKVTLKRSVIGMPRRYDWEKRIKVLRLHKTHRTSYLPITPIILGNVSRMLRLVKVEIVEGEPEKKRLWDKGYVVIGRADPLINS